MTLFVPFTADPRQLEGRASLQLNTLQSDRQEDKFSKVKLAEYWMRVDKDSYGELHTITFKALTMFGSTYVCECSFSTMNIIKTK